MMVMWSIDTSSPAGPEIDRVEDEYSQFVSLLVDFLRKGLTRRSMEEEEGAAEGLGGCAEEELAVMEMASSGEPLSAERRLISGKT